MKVYTCELCGRQNITNKEVTECFNTKCRGKVTKKEIPNDDSFRTAAYCSRCALPAQPKRLNGDSTQSSIPRSSTVPNRQGSVDTCPLCRRGKLRAGPRGYFSYTCGTRYHTVTKELIVQGDECARWENEGGAIMSADEFTWHIGPLDQGDTVETAVETRKGDKVRINESNYAIKSYWGMEGIVYSVNGNSYGITLETGQTVDFYLNEFDAVPEPLGEGIYAIDEPAMVISGSEAREISGKGTSGDWEVGDRVRVQIGEILGSINQYEGHVGVVTKVYPHDGEYKGWEVKLDSGSTVNFYRDELVSEGEPTDEPVKEDVETEEADPPLPPLEDDIQTADDDVNPEKVKEKEDELPKNPYGFSPGDKVMTTREGANQGKVGVVQSTFYPHLDYPISVKWEGISNTMRYSEDELYLVLQKGDRVQLTDAVSKASYLKPGQTGTVLEITDNVAYPVSVAMDKTDGTTHNHAFKWDEVSKLEEQRFPDNIIDRPPTEEESRTFTFKAGQTVRVKNHHDVPVEFHGCVGTITDLHLDGGWDSYYLAKGPNNPVPFMFHSDELELVAVPEPIPVAPWDISHAQSNSSYSTDETRVLTEQEEPVGYYYSGGETLSISRPTCQVSENTTQKSHTLSSRVSSTLYSLAEHVFYLLPTVFFTLLVVSLLLVPGGVLLAIWDSWSDGLKLVISGLVGATSSVVGGLLWAFYDRDSSF